VYALHQAPGGPTPLLVTLDAGAVVKLAGPPTGTAPERRHDPSFDLDTAYYTHAFTLSFPIKSRQARADSSAVPLSVRFQLCSERECQPPKTVHLLASIESRASP
jgi:Disulphide bond corrector protein DsbC